MSGPHVLTHFCGPGHGVPSMQSSKSQILAALKRHGRCSVDELALALSLAPMTVRQHLATLERDDFVASAEERQRLGRPHFVYFLTERGDESFPKRYDRIAIQLLHEVSRLDSKEIAGLSPEEKTALLFDKLADRFISRYRPRMANLRLPQRVAAVVELLQTEGGFAEWAALDDGYEIRDYNCCYRKLMGAEDESCRWHERILAGLLDSRVERRGDAPPAVQLCRFVVDQPEIVPYADRGPHATTAALTMRGSVHP